MIFVDVDESVFFMKSVNVIGLIYVEVIFVEVLWRVFGEGISFLFIKI